MNGLLTQKCDWCGARVWRWQLAYPHCSVREAVERAELIAQFYANADRMDACERWSE